MPVLRSSLMVIAEVYLEIIRTTGAGPATTLVPVEEMSVRACYKDYGLEQVPQAFLFSP